MKINLYQNPDYKIIADWYLSNDDCKKALEVAEKMHWYHPEGISRDAVYGAIFEKISSNELTDALETAQKIMSLSYRDDAFTKLTLRKRSK